MKGNEGKTHLFGYPLQQLLDEVAHQRVIRCVLVDDREVQKLCAVLADQLLR